MPTILTYFDDPGFFDYPFSEPEYLHAYHTLAESIAKRGGEFGIVRGPDTYKGKMTFSTGWKYINGEFREQQSPLRGDLVYVKGNNLRSGHRDRLINPAGLGAACGMDKQRTYEIFPELFPSTIEVESADDLRRAIDSMHTPWVVIKPVSGFGGFGVFIGPKEEAYDKEYEYPVIVQEFVDTSGGIEGITPSHHDFRMLVMDGEIFMTFLRIPPSGKLLSNVAQGGIMTVVPERMRPAGALELVKEVDSKLTVFEHRLYTIDCGYDKSGKWYVFELNDQPGLITPEECGPFAEDFYGGLAQYLIDCANE